MQIKKNNLFANDVFSCFCCLFSFFDKLICAGRFKSKCRAIFWHNYDKRNLRLSNIEQTVIPESDYARSWYVFSFILDMVNSGIFTISFANKVSCSFDCIVKCITYFLLDDSSIRILFRGVAQVPNRLNSLNCDSTHMRSGTHKIV